MKLQKKNLHVIGAAPSFEKLSSLIKSRLYWAKVEIKESDYIITNGTLYDVYNGNGKIENMLILASKGRWQLCEILK